VLSELLLIIEARLGYILPEHRSLVNILCAFVRGVALEPLAAFPTPSSLPTSHIRNFFEFDSESAAVGDN
jgi:hypothetical protein